MKKTILIVEDDPINSELLASLLSKNGYDVVQAKDGKAGSKLLDGGLAPCLILTDWVMPGNGEELIKHLRANDFLVTIPILIMTGTPELTNGVNLHGVQVLKKPLFDQTILGLIRDLAG